MKPSEAIKDKARVIEVIVHQHGFKNPRIYGSTARGDDHEGSDLDVLVERGEGRCTLVTIGRLCTALSEALGVVVDVKTSDLISDRILKQIKVEAVSLHG